MDEYLQTIYIERDSVCMGDDVTAPNAQTIQTSGDFIISQFLKQLADALPIVADTEPIVWSVHLGHQNGKVIGLIETVYQDFIRVKVFDHDSKMKDSGISRLYCRYYCKSTLMKPDQNGRLTIPMYPECPTLAEKVMKHMKVYKKQ